MIGNKNADIIRAIKNKKCCKDVVLESLSVTENNTYTAEEGKAWNEVNVNVQGGSTFNVNDIILADDLLEKCQALQLEAGNNVDTDWTFEDICTKDSCGILQAAFEDAVYEVNPKYPDEPDVTKGVFIYITNDNVEVGPFRPQHQEIWVYEPNSENYFCIAYNLTTKKYNVQYTGGV